jgi:hypothetical protein
MNLIPYTRLEHTHDARAYACVKFVCTNTALDPLKCLTISPPHLLTYFVTQRSRVLHEKLTESQLVKKFSAFYGTRWFITAFTNARHLSLS